MNPKPFLSARWEYLAMINYVVDESVLRPYVPPYTELDRFEGKLLVSLVGFLFNDTRVFGLRWPMHTNFEEVNLRFYLRHFDGGTWKRGVGFVSEIVPSPVIAGIANSLYNERYSVARMRHNISVNQEQLDVAYRWQKFGKKWNSIHLTADLSERDIVAGSAEEFILEHYFGYNGRDARTTISYAVEHPRWKVFPVNDYEVNCDVASLYGREFVPFIEGVRPHSVMLARGSEVVVRKPILLGRV